MRTIEQDMKQHLRLNVKQYERLVASGKCSVFIREQNVAEICDTGLVVSYRGQEWEGRVFFSDRVYHVSKKESRIWVELGVVEVDYRAYDMAWMVERETSTEFWSWYKSMGYNREILRHGIFKIWKA